EARRSSVPEISDRARPQAALTPLARAPRTPTPAPFLPPTGLFVRTDSERQLRDQLVGERGVGRVEASRPAVAEETLGLALLEHPKAAGEIERAVNDPERPFDGMVLGRHDLDGPVGMCDAVGPIPRDGVEMRSDRFELQDDLRNAVLYFGVVGHRPAEPDRFL